jgi:hypothetical protein
VPASRVLFVLDEFGKQIRTAVVARGDGRKGFGWRHGCNLVTPLPSVLADRNFRNRCSVDGSRQTQAKEEKERVRRCQQREATRLSAFDVVFRHCVVLFYGRLWSFVSRWTC